MCLPYFKIQDFSKDSKLNFHNENSLKFSTSKWCLQILSQYFMPLKTFPIYTTQLWTLLDDLWPVIPFADPPPLLSIDLIVTEALKYPGILPISNKKPGIVHNCTLHWVHFPTWNSMKYCNEFKPLMCLVHVHVFYQLCEFQYA